MSDGIKYKPAGGVVAAELYPVRGLASPAGMTAGSGVAVELCDAGCSYTESFSVEECRVKVEHKLVLRADPSRAEAWFGEKFLSQCGCEGVAARIRLASGETMVVGWSSRFGFEQALRLRSLTLHSGGEAVEAPCVELVLAACDTSRAARDGAQPVQG